MSMTFVLLMSEFVISIFRKCIPNAIRLPVFIIIIAAFTTIVQFVLQAYVESLYDALGVFLPLIVVNCIIMGRVESFASKNNVGNSILDALGMGIGYTCVLVVISLVREFFGGGTLMAGTSVKLELIPEGYTNCINRGKQIIGRSKKARADAPYKIGKRNFKQRAGRLHCFWTSWSGSSGFEK